jgi:hypothetical protein
MPPIAGAAFAGAHRSRAGAFVWMRSSRVRSPRRPLGTSCESEGGVASDARLSSISMLPTTSRSSLEFGSGARSRPAAGRRDWKGRTRAAQEAVDRGLAGIEHLGDLPGAEAEHVAQHEHRALPRREMLKADDER